MADIGQNKFRNPELFMINWTLCVIHELLKLVNKDNKYQNVGSIK